MTVRSRRLVIDASVARSSGPPGAVDPTASSCRQFLLEARTICHRLVLTSAVQDEWDEHQSEFARTWRVSMAARRKIDVVDAADDAVLRTQVEKAAATPKDAEAMLKDCPLLEAAMRSDGIVISRDETARALFRSVAVRIRHIRDIMWVNPATRSDEVLAWLRDGAPVDRTLRLGHRDV